MSGDKTPIKIAGFGVTTADAARLTAFYRRAFGAVPHSSQRVNGASRQVMLFENTFIDFWQFDSPGRPYPYAYPRTLSPYDTVFQHFAIVVSDMQRAMERLRSVTGWNALSQGGPQRLPHRSGGVTAFKFQDPEGHPLELLAFAPQATPPAWHGRGSKQVFLGIDHSAISVRNTEASVAFYGRLGFEVGASTQNRGLEQARLDGVPDPRVEVTTLSLPHTTPHLELLCYQITAASGDPRTTAAANDIAASRLWLLTPTRAAGAPLDDLSSPPPDDLARTGAALVAASAEVLDPDGHRLLIV